FLTENIFKPYGLTSTGFMVRATIFGNPRYAPGVVWDQKRCTYVRPETIEGNEFVWYLSGRFGPGRLTSTVNDLLKWDELLYSGKLLSEASLKEMFAPHIKTSGKRKEHYGYGWVNVDSLSVKGQEIYHTGSWPGNLTYIKRYIGDRSTVILLNNTNSPYILVIRNTVDAILKGVPYEFPKRNLDELLRKD